MKPIIEGFERRFLDIELEFRADDAKKPLVRGYAAVFGKSSVPMGFFSRFTEIIERGAFKDALADGRSVPLLIEHEGLALADTETKSLALAEDETGLRFEAELDPDDPDTQRVLPKLKRGTLRKMSFGFTLAPQGDEWTEGKESGALIRTIKKVQSLFDVSLVTNPAYPDTSAAVRSLETWQKGQVPAPTDDPARELRKRKLLLTGM
jgi:uncharacterized protein